MPIAHTLGGSYAGRSAAPLRHAHQGVMHDRPRKTQPKHENFLTWSGALIHMDFETQTIGKRRPPPNSKMDHLLPAAPASETVLETGARPPVSTILPIVHDPGIEAYLLWERPSHPKENERAGAAIMQSVALP